MTTYGIEMTPAEKAAIMLSSRSTRDLIHDLEMSGIMMDVAHELHKPYDPQLPTVRGWIMDEIQRRDPEGYEAWIMQDDYPEDIDLLKFIRC